MGKRGKKAQGQASPGGEDGKAAGRGQALRASSLPGLPPTLLRLLEVPPVKVTSRNCRPATWTVGQVPRSLPSSSCEHRGWDPLWMGISKASAVQEAALELALAGGPWWG